MVAVFGETTGAPAFRELHKIMSNDEEGRLILRCCVILQLISYGVLTA